MLKISVCRSILNLRTCPASIGIVAPWVQNSATKNGPSMTIVFLRISHTPSGRCTLRQLPSTWLLQYAWKIKLNLLLPKGHPLTGYGTRPTNIALTRAPRIARVLCHFLPARLRFMAVRKAWHFSRRHMCFAVVAGSSPVFASFCSDLLRFRAVPPELSFKNRRSVIRFQPVPCHLSWPTTT